MRCPPAKRPAARATGAQGRYDFAEGLPLCQSFYFRDESEYYGGKAMCSIDFRLDDLIFTQKREYTKIPEVFSIVGGYMQLISTIFTLLSVLANKLYPQITILNGIFNFDT